MFNFVAFIPSAVKQSIPLLLGSTVSSGLSSMRII